MSAERGADFESELARERWRSSQLAAALRPFADFFKSEHHDLSPNRDDTPVAMFLDDSKVPVASVHIGQFRVACNEYAAYVREVLDRDKKGR